MREAKGNQRFIREYNRGLVVNLLRTDGPMSRADLARRTGLAPSALTQRIRDLIDEGLVTETGKGESSTGRPPTLVSLNPNYASAVGVKIERTRLRAARVNLAGTVRARYEIDFDPFPEPLELISLLEKAVEHLNSTRILGVGISVSGFVDTINGIDLYSPILGWENVPLVEPLKERLDLPVHLENDVNALTVAESWHGAGADYRNFFCLTVGEGIGAGLVVDGSLYRGAFGGAGEAGHMMIDPSGPRCRCGERGCLEVFASDQYLKREALRLGYADIDQLEQASREQDEQAIGVFERMGHYLGIGAKNLVNVLNPQAIVLGGERMEASDLFLPAFEAEVREHSFAEAAKDLEIVPALLGEDGFLIGAATIVAAEFFQLPTERTPR
jgi:predicted NBD/HSP70 family sugar kinase